MTLDNYPFWKDLVSEIKGPNSTDGWDILVSYEMSHLNDFLNRTWDSKNNSDQPLEQFEVKRYEKHHHVDCLHSIATWNVTLKPPTLQFAFDHAVLRMAVSGTVSIQYYTGDAGHETKDGDPETGPISDGWTMIVTTSMSSVTVTEGGDIQDRRVSSLFFIEISNPLIGVPIMSRSCAFGFANYPELQAQGTIIDFSSDPSHKGQIVFDCGLSDDFTVTFKWTGKNDPKESVPEDNLEQARRWIKNHVKAIDFSLASIAKDQDPSSSFLTPEKMTFQLYHPLKEDPDAWTQVGCLSVYIKTRQTGEGQGVGHEVPSFSGGRMYPVAGGYSASIILSSWYYQWYETNIDVDLRHGILNMVWYGFHLEGDWIPDYQDRSSYADDFLMLAQLPWD